MNLHVEVPGLDAWVRRFKGADRIVSEELHKATMRSGLAVEAGAKREVRKRTRTLQRSITAIGEQRGLYSSVTIGSSVPYARAQDNPTATPYIIRPKNGRFLVFIGRDGKKVFARLVNHPGIKGNRYLTGTFERLKPQIRKEYGLVPKRVIARLRGGA